MSNPKDHFQFGATTLNASSELWTGGGFGVLVVSSGTVISSLSSDVVNSELLTGVTLSAGLYLPIGVSSIDLSSGTVLVGANKK